MKKFFVCLFAAVALFTTGCSKDDDSVSGKAVAVINGKEYSFENYIWDFQNEKEYVLFAEGLDQTENLMIHLKDKKVGEVSFSDVNSISVMLGESMYSSLEGKINVTTADSKIIGTFAGTFKKGLISTTTVKISGSFTADKWK